MIDATTRSGLADRPRPIWRGSGVGLAATLCAHCTRAPSFDILGSYFPAWLVCLAIAVLLTVLTRALLLRFEIPLAVPVVAYPSLTALFTFAIWLACFR